MKSLFVLGLAIAANAQVDNELYTGAELVKYAKQSQQTVYRPTAHVVRDDADDELYSGAELVKYAKQSQSTTYRPTAHVVSRDDAADDELIVYQPNLPKSAFKTEAEWLRYIMSKSEEVADDELIVYQPNLPKSAFKTEAEWLRYIMSKSEEVADDELYSGADLVKYAKQSQQTVYRPTAHVVRDDADDELYSGADLVKYAKQSQSTTYRPTAHVVSRDDAADDELIVYQPNLPKSAFKTEKEWLRYIMSKSEEVADDELVQTFYSPSGADLVKYAKQSQQTVYRPTAHVVRDDADDELYSGADLVKYAKQSQSTTYRPTAHVVSRDDAADDELIVYQPNLPKSAFKTEAEWLRYIMSKSEEVADDELVQTFYSPSGADLVKYAKQSQQTVYRPTAHVVSRDDEADDELAYLAHLIRETQPEKTEKKPEIRRKFRHAEKN